MKAARRSSRARERCYRLLLVVTSVVVTLLVGEVAVRLYETAASTTGSEMAKQLEHSAHVAPDQSFGRRSLVGLVRASSDPELVYELKPGLVGTFLGAPFAFNAQGLRDRDYALAKSPGVFRIVALGDSVMFGWGVGQDQSYLEIVEGQLNKGRGQAAGEATPFEMLNFAVPGYNTAMEIAALKGKALAFDPDLIILHFVANDLDLPRFMLQPKPVWTLRRSALLQLVATRLGWLMDRPGQELIAHDLAPLPEEERQGVRSQYRHMIGEAGFRQAMARLATMAEDRSLPVLVMAAEDEGEPWGAVREVVTEHRFESLVYGDLYDAHLVEHGLERTPRSWKDTFWLSRRDPHPNVLSHQLIAARLLEKLQAMGLGAAPRQGKERRRI